MARLSERGQQAAMLLKMPCGDSEEEMGMHVCAGEI